MSRCRFERDFLLRPEVARALSPAERKALDITTPEQDAEKYEARAEKELLTLCCNLLNQREIVWHHDRDSRGEKAGWPDLVFCISGRAIAAELKSATGKLRPEQVTTLDQMRRNGWETYLVRSFADFEAVLDGVAAQWQKYDPCNRCA